MASEQAEHGQDRWERICTLFEEASSLRGSERDAFLDSACADDARLRSEVDSLIESAEDEKSAAFEWSPTTVLFGNDGSVAGSTIGAYRLVEPLAAGGMGDVWLASRADGTLEQRVAIKLIRPGMATEDVVRRFRRERQLLADLEHPNIARLLDGGATSTGQPYLVMEYVEGVPIDEHCRTNDLALEERVELFLEVCAAVAHAHRNLVIHRDLKPSNLLVDREGNPKLLDFGIAKILEGRPMKQSLLLTGEHARLLTPGYASPEQLRGDTVTTASDVFGLGVVLYELLAGRSPRSGRTGDDLSGLVAIEPRRPSTAVLEAGSAGDDRSTRLAEKPETERRHWARRLRGDLDNITLMALREEPSRRYPTVDALMADLRRFLDGEPVTARPNTAWYVTGKFLRRNRRAFFAAGLGAFAATVIALTLVMWFVLLPRWSDAAVREARLALVGPELQAATYNAIFWNLPNERLNYAGLQTDDLEVALAAYDRAMRFGRAGETARRERDAVRDAIDALRSPEATHDAQLEAILGADGADPSPQQLRQAGLFMIFSDRPREALTLLTRYEAHDDSDSLVEAILGELYLTVNRPALAYPRLRMAHSAFPESRSLTIGLAEAAIGVDDVERGRVLLAMAAGMDGADDPNRRAHVGVRLLEASGAPAETVAAAYRTAIDAAETPSSVVNYEYARTLERCGKMEEALYWYCAGTFGAPEPVVRPVALTSARRLSGYVDAMERWIRSWTAEDRARRLRDAPGERVMVRQSLTRADVTIPFGLRDRLSVYTFAKGDLLLRPAPLEVAGGSTVPPKEAWAAPTQASALAELMQVENGALWTRLRDDQEPVDADLVDELVDAWVAADIERAKRIIVVIVEGEGN